MEAGGQHKFILFDTRAAVHAKLGQNREALKDAKKTIDLAPDRFHGYARAARAFLACNNADAAHKMVTMSLARLKETEAERRVALLSLQADVQRLQAALEDQRIRSIDHIGKLPIEIFGEIAMILIEDDHTSLITLLHVCKHWRDVIQDHPRFWCKLVLTKRRPKAKAKLWIEKSKGRVRDLTVRYEAALSPNWFGELLHGLQWDQLRFCSVESWDVLSYVTSIGQQTSIARWIGLEIHNDPFLLIKDVHIRPASLALQHLSLCRTRINLGDENDLTSHVSELRSCSFNHSQVMGEWSDFLRRNPLLESLRLIDLCGTLSHSTEAPQLPHLTSLDLDGYVPAEILRAEMPQLHQVKLRRPKFFPGVFLQHLFDTNTVRLTDLQLHSCMLHETTTLIALLGISPNLQVLEITNLVAGVASLIEALAAHHIPPSSSQTRFPEDEPKPGPLLCPKLTHVNFSGCPEVQTGPLLRLIKSRLVENSPSSVSINGERAAAVQVAKLESLIINACPNVSGEWLPQIRMLVPHVSCTYITKRRY